MKRPSPLIKGVITAAAILLTSVILFYTRAAPYSFTQYLVFAIYASGIIWTMRDYAHSESYTGKFGDLFSQGFRCFIIVTLIMAVFTAIFGMMNPQMIEESAGYYREELLKRGGRLSPEIDQMVADYKKQYITSSVSISVFGYLITGAFFTAAGAAFFLMKRKK